VSAWLTRAVVLACLAMIAIVVVSATTQAAERPRVALVGVDAPLTRAAVVALSPWDVEVVVRRDFGGGDSATFEERARTLARDEGFGAVAWLSSTTTAGTQISVYDAESDRVVSRVVGGSPPFDDKTAAAAALTLKMILRTSVVAPAAERRAAAAASTAPSPPAPPASSSTAAPPPPPSPSASTAPRDRPPPIEPPPPIDANRSPMQRLLVELGVGARELASGTIDPRATLGAVFESRALGRWLGFGVAASLGTGADVRTSDVDARFADRAFALSLRVPFRVAPHVAIAPSVGPGLHWTVLDGVVGPARSALHVERFDFAVDAAVRVTWTLTSSLDVGASIDAVLLPRSQRYTIDEGTVLRFASFQPGVTLWLSAGVL
jgi:hypothetical protein